MTRLLYTALTGIIIATSTLSASDQGPFIGIGYASTSMDLTLMDGLSVNTQDLLDASTDSVVFTAGYKLNENLALEGRYYINATQAKFEYELGNTPLSGTYKAESLALYVKPMYKIEAFTLYGLLGVTFNDYTITSIVGASDDEALFSWGGGAQFNLTDSLSLFIDYTNLGKSDAIVRSDLSSWNFGLNVQF